MPALQLQRHLNDGANPPGSIVLDANSNVYGTAFCGPGVVCEIRPNGLFNDGKEPFWDAIAILDFNHNA